jgi:hypothetical protein
MTSSQSKEQEQAMKRLMQQLIWEQKNRKEQKK